MLAAFAHWSALLSCRERLFWCSQKFSGFRRPIQQIWQRILCQAISHTFETGRTNRDQATRRKLCTTKASGQGIRRRLDKAIPTTILLDNITQMAGFETIPAGPWDPPILDSSGIERMWLGLNFSISCNSTCRANLPMCNETEVLRCYGFPDSECNCSEKLLPTELKHMKHNSLPYGPHYAVLLAGQTRSFYSDFMLDFWKHFLDRFNDVALLAVLSKVSTQKVKDSGLAELKLNTKTNETIRKCFFKTRNLVASVISLNTSLWNVLVLNDACQWPVAAKAVQDPALRAMLSPPRNTDPKGSGGWSNGYRAKVIAFDLMLRMEANIKQRLNMCLS